MKIKSDCFIVILTLIAFLFCLSSSIFITLINIPAYLLSIYWFHITILSPPQLIMTYIELLKFLLIPQQSFSLSYFDISKSAVQHFYDVKRWIMINNIIIIVSGIISYMTRKYIKLEHYRTINNTLKAIIIMLVCLGLMMIIDFNHLFIIFHEILFQGSYWQFDTVKDAIILALPEQFFMLCFLQVIIYCMTLLFWYYKYIRRK